MTGFIYAIECGGMVKLGYSTKPRLRFVKIQSDSPFECKLLGYWDGTVDDETAVHAMFATSHAKGEWFHNSPDLLAFVSERTVDIKAPQRHFTTFRGHQVPRGTKRRIAEFLKINPGAVSQWETRGIPPERVAVVSYFTKIPPGGLHPMFEDFGLHQLVLPSELKGAA